MKPFPLAALFAATCLAFLHGTQARAAPIVWSSASGGNDHAYEFIQVANPFTGNNNAWATASAAASASVFNGQSGYLATVTSLAENSFLMSLVPGGLSQGAGAWLGGDAPEGWLVGPEAGQAFGFTNFGGVEPNNAGLVYLIVGSSFGGVNPGQWADDSFVQGVPDANFDRVVGYFVEYNRSAAIPEPASWLLAGMSGLAVLAVRRGRRAV